MTREPHPVPVVETDVPARLDRLPWAGFHWLVVVALGITWILDGLEVTLAGSVAPALRESPTLRFTASDVGLANSAYLAGAVLGALFFGWLTDRMGRKRLFTVTLLIYLTATAATALTWDLPSFAAMRFLTGAGIGGEYSAINSAIQELIPARRRGWTDLVVNGSYWVGAAVAGGLAVIVLDPAVLNVDLGWRFAFLFGATTGLAIIFLRRHLPESPRWLITHGRAEEAEAIVTRIERRVAEEGHALDPVDQKVRLRARRSTPLSEVFTTLLHTYPHRTALGLLLMASQAFLYNAIFFTYALMLSDFYGVPSADVGWYVLPFAAGNVLGPLLLGRLFDTVGRRQMIALTYGLSGLLLAATGLLFTAGLLDATTQTLCWSLTFFFASAAASSAYLTVAESFPLEIRALAIALFYAMGTGIGGVLAPWLFGVLIESGSREQVLTGYLFAAVLMIVAAAAAWKFGLSNERKPLEHVARPLSWHED
ncbi:MFS transporter [Novosphingobium mangrovi (ex Huang et al. 2023)]|uniref:MFS transporter n=1 Tax=Novosphingobium mangrovi (ex Huang et al. 2023) TaxID=2976432 RepID=A0ABT2I4P3_9SPHN|nr:MFS transporter [Novosphingobium mangrovi (ex Huang et al. 2023)]MCT2399772.1 MFS transporter [Novosphingobium mangrovi (ex Huang et al. 2023)]